jgi:hypothetical protein
MKSQQLATTAGALVTLGLIAMCGMLMRPTRVHADDHDQEGSNRRSDGASQAESSRKRPGLA